MDQPAKEAQRPSRLGSVQPRCVNEGMMRQKARSYQFLSIKPAARQNAIPIRHHASRWGCLWGQDHQPVSAKAQTRSPKSEGRKKAEPRNPKCPSVASAFGIRPSFGFRPSEFGFDRLAAGGAIQIRPPTATGPNLSPGYGLGPPATIWRNRGAECRRLRKSLTAKGMRSNLRDAAAR
jgi:hypothetical protein